MAAPLSIRFSRALPKGARVTTVTVSTDRLGRYHVSLLCDDAVVPKPEAPGRVGIDLGLIHFATLACGGKIAVPRILAAGVAVSAHGESVKPMSR